MARKNPAPVIPEDQQREIYAEIANMKSLLGRLDQFQACGVDCDAFRRMAHEVVQSLEDVVRYVIKGEAVPTS